MMPTLLCLGWVLLSPVIELPGQEGVAESLRAGDAAVSAENSAEQSDPRAGTGRLMTRWAEYPRPQMVRGEWRRLNGLWDYAVTGQGVEWKKPSVGLFESVA